MEISFKENVFNVVCFCRKKRFPEIFYEICLRLHSSLHCEIWGNFISSLHWDLGIYIGLNVKFYSSLAIAPFTYFILYILSENYEAVFLG